MTRKSAKTTASSPPIRTAEGKTESPSVLLPPQQLKKGALEKKLDLPEREKGEKKEEEG